MKRYWLIRAFKVALFAVVAFGAVGLVTMGLWNWLAPDLFGGHMIGFLQALGLFALCRLLIGGLRGHGGRRMHWRHRMAERWDGMSEEERTKVRESMRGRCGHGHADPAQDTA